eukprot:13550520-Alexandrium_andersonii.AAC.1
MTVAYAMWYELRRLRSQAAQEQRVAGEMPPPVGTPARRASAGAASAASGADGPAQSSSASASSGQPGGA